MCSQLLGTTNVKNDCVSTYYKESLSESEKDCSIKCTFGNLPLALKHRGYHTLAHRPSSLDFVLVIHGYADGLQTYSIYIMLHKLGTLLYIN